MTEDKKDQIKVSAKQKLMLKHLVKELEKHRGRHTELVTVYIPAGYDINKVINQLSQEQGTASNIKSAATRNNVISALERMVQHLRLYKQTPENGLAVFSGNVSEREGAQDFQVWGIEPPVPLNVRIYRCDKEFILDPIKEMIEHEDVFGMVVIDGRDATIALLKGKTIIPLQKTHSEVPGKMKAGGQSAPRFARQREGAQRDHYKKVADYIQEQFLYMKELKGILIGGPSTTTNAFVTRDFLNPEIQKKIIAIKDLSYTGDFGLQELLERSQDVLAEEEVAKEKMLMQKFFGLLATKPDMVSYGEHQVMNALQMGAVDIILLSEVKSDDLEKWEEEAKRFGTNIEVISVETREGVQLKEIGGYAAILRYPVHI